MLLEVDRAERGQVRGRTASEQQDDAPDQAADLAEAVAAAERGEARLTPTPSKTSNAGSPSNRGGLLERRISWSAAWKGAQDCRLIGGTVPSPTCADVPETPRLEFGEFQRRVEQLAQEFFCSRDVDGMVASVLALECSSYHDELVAKLLRLSMDRKSDERDAVVSLLNKLSADGHVSAPQLARGFEKLVLSWDDLQLDVPDAAGQLATLLLAEVGFLDKALFARLPEGLLRKLCAGPLSDQVARRRLERHLGELVQFKAALQEHLNGDLFERGSVEALAGWLTTADMPVFHHEVVLAACKGAIGEAAQPDRQGLALQLLSHLSTVEEGATLGDVDMQMGFSRFLGEIGCGSGDVTKQRAEQMVAILRGAVQKELLPADFLKSAKRLRFGGVQGVEVLRQAQRQTPLYSRRVWGTGDARSFQSEVRNAILEYFDSGSAEELGNIIDELHLSGDEQARFMRKLMVTGMEAKDGDTALDAMSALLGRCWSLEEVRLAFEQLRDVAQDLVLDLPHCRELTNDLVWAAVGRGLLERADLINDGASIV